ncbi:MAG: gliding motility-associated C-terminal domain-containing protein [Cytophagaceae bacterium]
MRFLKYIVSLVFITVCSLQVAAQAVDACISVPGQTIINKTITICKGTIFTLQGSNCGTATTGLSYRWQNTSYPGPPTYPFANVTRTDSGRWVLRVRDSFGNEDFDTIFVRYHPSPAFAITNDPDLVFKCRNDPLILNATQHADISGYNWYIDDVNSPSVGTSHQLTVTSVPNGSAEYIATAVDTYGCTLSDTVFVWELQSPPVNLGPDRRICQGTSITLSSPSTSGGIFTYLWNTGAKTPTINVSTAGKYWLTVEGPFPFPCSATDTIQIFVDPRPTVSAGPNATICYGSEHQLEASVTSGTAPFSYTWSPAASLSQSNIYNPVARPTNSTSYKVVVRDSGGSSGCRDSATVNISVNPRINIEPLFSDSTICKGADVTLGASVTGGTPNPGPSYSYEWKPSASLDDATLQSPEASPEENTLYTLIVTDSYDCTDSTKVRVRIADLVVEIEEGDDAQLCLGDSLSLFAYATGGESDYVYTWSPAEVISGENEEVYASPVTPGYVYVTVSDKRNCQYTDSINFIINPLPVGNAGINDTICEGTSTNITGIMTTSTVGPYSYRWTSQNSSTILTGASQNVTPEQSKEYYLRISDGRNCRSLPDTVKVVLIPKPYVNLGDPYVAQCTGLSVDLDASDPQNAGFAFEWRNLSDNSIIGTGTAISVNQPGNFSVTVTEPVNNCSATIQKEVRYIETPLGVVIIADTVFNVEEELALLAEGSGEELSYTWSGTGAGDFSGEGESVIYLPTDDDIGQISMSVIASNICGTVSAELLVRGFKPIVPEEYKNIFIPNAFSPTAANEQNKALRVFGMGVSEDGFMFEVFNRWGELVYRTNDFSEANNLGWSGQNSPMGVYTYVVRGKFKDGEEFQKTNNVTLVR